MKIVFGTTASINDHPISILNETESPVRHRSNISFIFNLFSTKFQPLLIFCRLKQHVQLYGGSNVYFIILISVDNSNKHDIPIHFYFVFISI